MIRSIIALALTPVFLAVAKKKSTRSKRAPVAVQRSGRKQTQSKRKPKQPETVPAGKKGPPARVEEPKAEVVPAPPPLPPAPPIQAPALLSPQAGESTENLTPNFRWFYVGSASHYELVWSPDTRFHKAHILLTNQTAASLPPEQALVQGTTYVWRVRGGNEGGWGPWSATWNFTTPIE